MIKCTNSRVENGANKRAEEDGQTCQLTAVVSLSSSSIATAACPMSGTTELRPRVLP